MMRPRRFTALLGLGAAVSLGFALDVAVVGAAFSQVSALHGTWRLGTSTKTDQAFLGLHYTWHGRSNQQWGRSIPLAALDGVTPGALDGEDAPVSFRVVRDAGTIVCRGSAAASKGRLSSLRNSS